MAFELGNSAMQVGKYAFDLKAKNDSFHSLEQEIESAKVFAGRMTVFVEDQIARLNAGETVVASCALATLADSINALAFFIKESFEGLTNGGYQRLFPEDGSLNLTRMVNNIQMEFAAYLVERQAYTDAVLDHLVKKGMPDSALRTKLTKMAHQCARLELSFAGNYSKNTCKNCLLRKPPQQTITEAFVQQQSSMHFSLPPPQTTSPSTTTTPQVTKQKGMFSVFR